MEFTNFLTSDILSTFMMALVIVELWVMFTKEFLIIKKIPTKVYTFLLAVIHLLIINGGMGTLDLTTIGIYTMFCNGLIMSVLLCGGYDVAIGNIIVNKKE